MPELDLLQNLSIDREALIVLLSLPIVATIVGIARHIVGAKSLGIYAPIVLTYSFFALSLDGRYQTYPDILLGIRYGLAFTLVVLTTSVLGTWLVKRARMHYFPKISINLSLVAAALLASLILADLLGREGFTSTNALALVLIASVAEQFTATLFKKNLRTAFLITAETTIISIFSYLLIAWPSFQDLLLKYPYLVLLTFVINYAVGKYRGLRFREFVRFREVLNQDPQKEE
jgi:hypothetical protein